MATSAFKSTTKRMQIGSSPVPAEDSASVNRSHRRSRSLSCFSRRLTEPPAEEFEVNPTPRRNFVNTVRGSEFPEISLDDLAIELFDSGSDERGGRSALWSSETTPAQRRGRSVSRHGPRVSGGGGGETRGRAGNSSGGRRVVLESKRNSRQRRSVSVARYRMRDSESDFDHTHNRSTAKSKDFTSGNNQTPLSRKSLDSNYRPGLRSSLSEKDLKCHDDYSSQSSVLTDDEGKDAYIYKNGAEKIIRAVYSEKKAKHPAGNDMKSGIYGVMQKELRHAAEEIRTELEQSEKRKQDLLAEIVLEEQHGRELSKIVKELLPEPKKIVSPDRPSQTRRRSNDKGRVSKRLTEEAERYIEDFISNVEDTDISSLDGESSSLGGIMKGETFQRPGMSTPPPPVFMDGVVLPWLRWETSNDGTPMGCRNKTEPPMTPKSFSWGASQQVTNAQGHSQSASSRGSWSPGIIDSLPFNIMENASSKIGESGNYQRQSHRGGSNPSRFDMEKYLQLKNNEDFLLETLKQQRRIGSGGLLLCNRMLI